MLERFIFNNKNKKKCIYKEECELLDKAIKMILMYLEIFDLEYGTISLEVFKRLYIKRKNKNLQEIAKEFHMDIKTLYNYRKRFNILFEKISHIIKLGKKSENSFPIFILY